MRQCELRVGKLILISSLLSADYDEKATPIQKRHDWRNAIAEMSCRLL